MRRSGLGSACQRPQATVHPTGDGAPKASRPLTVPLIANSSMSEFARIDHPANWPAELELARS